MYAAGPLLRSLLPPVLYSASTLLVASVALSATTFTPLGDLPGGIDYSLATAISADGTWVVGCSQATADREAFRWSEGTGLESLGEAPGGAHSSCAYGVSLDGGVVVGTTETATGPSAFRWTATNGLEVIARPGAATGVSDDGQIIVGASPTPSTPGDDYGWYSDPGVITTTTTTSDPIRAIAGNGSQIGLMRCHPEFPYECEAILSEWSGSGYVQFTVWGSNATVVDISADGSFAGLDDLGEATLRTYDGGATYKLPNSDGNQYGYPQFTSAHVSADGKSVAGYGQNDVAFLWTEQEGTRTAESVLTDAGVDLTGWTLTQLRGISDDGRFVIGIGTNPSGDLEAFVAEIDGAAAVPAVGVTWLLILALAGTGSLAVDSHRQSDPISGWGISIIRVWRLRTET